MKSTKKRLFGMLTLIAGVMLVFALSSCDNGDNNNNNGPSGPTWKPVDIDPIEGTRSGNTITFTYEGSEVTLTKSGGGDSLDGVWTGTFDGDPVRVTVSGSNWTMAVLDGGSYVDYAKGTVSASDNVLTIIVTFIMDYEEGSGGAIGGGVGIEYPVVSYEGTWYGMRVLPGGEFHLKIVAENGSWIQYLVIDNMDIANSRGTYTLYGQNVVLTIADSNTNTFVNGGAVTWTPFNNLSQEQKLELHYLTTATMSGTISGGDAVVMNMGDTTVTFTRQPTDSGTSDGFVLGEFVPNP